MVNLESVAREERDLLAAYRRHINVQYCEFLERLDLSHTIEEAHGAVLVDSRGKQYIDFVAGYGLFNFGHNPPTVIAALRSELSSKPFWSRPFLSAPLVNLAEKLASLTQGDLDKVYVCSTGAEAVDSAIKLARLSTRRPEILAATGAFHGNTVGALSLCGLPALRKPFEPLLPGIQHVSYGDSSQLADAVSERTAAVLLEPIQAEIGGETPADGYLESAREICDRVGALLIVDEVRTGLGRTGPLFSIEREPIVPDILVIGKSLAGGIVPIGAMLARSNLWTRFGLSFPMSASSFAGNRLACVAAIEMLETVHREALLEKGAENAELFWAGLNRLRASYPAIVHRITGKGLLIGLHFANPNQLQYVLKWSISHGLLVAAAFCNSRCLLIEPPLILNPDEVQRGIDIITAACHSLQERT